MLGIIKSLPGIPRPMIFPTNRGGVWTIDESRALVPFGGDFPKSVLSDQFAIDPVWLCSSFMLARIDRRLAGNARA